MKALHDAPASLFIVPSPQDKCTFPQDWRGSKDVLRGIACLALQAACRSETLVTKWDEKVHGKPGTQSKRAAIGDSRSGGGGAAAAPSLTVAWIGRARVQATSC